ncbi:MAG: CRTAC1 family protein [Planctomycetia bacterium]|nr:CRTAC1 family protein [Planctomycetia bacterium]
MPRFESDVPADDAVIGRALKWSLGMFVVVLSIGGGLVFYFDRPLEKKGEVRIAQNTATPRERPVASLPAIPLTDVTRDAGITFIHTSGARGEKLLPESMGAGCAFFDYNNDGRPDILLINSDDWPGQRPADAPAPRTALYRNDGEGKFTDVTAECGLDLTFYGQGAAVGDFDNDGWVDVFFSAVGFNRLFRNNQGKFEDITASAGVAGDERQWSTSCAWLDYDRDGDLDLFVCNYIRWSAELDRQLECTLVGGKVRAYCRPDAFEGTFPYLYRNDGNGRFTDVSAEAGVQVRNPNTGAPVAKSLGVVPIDVDGDGWIDLIVANDTVQNFLLHNRRDGTFEEIGMKMGIALDSRTGLARAGMGIDVGFPRNDKYLAVIIGNFANEETAFYCAECGSFETMLFTDEAVANGLGPSSRIWLKFGLFYGDMDLDGRLDIVVANGHLENDIQQVQWAQRWAQPPQLFWNAGVESSTEFYALPADNTGTDFARPMVGRGAAYADIDGDGDLDVLLTSTGGAPRLLRNDQRLGHHWLRLKLVGTKCNRDAIGALVEVHAGGVVQRRPVMPARSYLSQVELPVTFGLGANDTIDRVTILWPDGSTQDVPDVKVDQLLSVEQK